MRRQHGLVAHSALLAVTSHERGCFEHTAEYGSDGTSSMQKQRDEAQG